MSKKITLLLVLSIITLQNSFAMKTEIAPMRPRKGFQRKQNFMNIFGQYNKQAQDLSNQLQNLESNKNKLIKDNIQVNVNIETNAAIIAGANTAQTVARCVAPVIDILTGGVTTVGVLIVGEVVERWSVKLRDCIEEDISKLEKNNNVLDRIKQNEIKIHCFLSKLKENKDVLNKINKDKITFIKKEEFAEVLVKGAIEVVLSDVSDSEFDRPSSFRPGKLIINVQDTSELKPAKIIPNRDPIMPIDRFLYVLELHRAFSGSDSESGIMYPHHPEHNNLVSNFFISESDVSAASDVEIRSDNQNRIAIIYVTPRETSDEGTELDEPSGSGWESDAIERPHNYALLTDDAYNQYDNIYDFIRAHNNY